MAKSKPKTEKVEVRLPIPVIAFYEGVAAYSGVSIGQAIAVVLAIEMLKKRSTLPTG